MLYVSRASRHPHGAKSVIQHVVDMFMAAVPIPVPTVLIFSLFRCVVKLKQQNVAVLQPVKINAAAAVQVVVFDKTGTLTGSLVSHAQALLNCGHHAVLCSFLTTVCSSAHNKATNG